MDDKLPTVVVIKKYDFKQIKVHPKSLTLTEIDDESIEEGPPQLIDAVPTSNDSDIKVKTFLPSTAYFLPIGFLVATIFALIFPKPGLVASSIKISDVGVIQAVNSFNVFFLSGISLNVFDARKALESWYVLLYGVFLILILTPLFALAVVHIPIHPHEYALGLAIFCTVPTSLGVGVTLTSACEGDQSLALLLTLITNCFGIVTTTPFAVQFLISSSSINFQYVELFVKLCLTVLAPTIIGMSLRAVLPGVADFTKTNQLPLSLFSNLNLVCIIWQVLRSRSPT